MSHVCSHLDLEILNGRRPAESIAHYTLPTAKSGLSEGLAGRLLRRLLSGEEFLPSRTNRIHASGSSLQRALLPVVVVQLFIHYMFNKFVGKFNFFIHIYHLISSCMVSLSKTNFPQFCQHIFLRNLEFSLVI